MKNLSEICVVSWDLDGTLYSMDTMKKVLYRHLMGSILGGASRVRDAAMLIQLNAAMSRCRGDTERVASFLDSPKGETFLQLQAHWIAKALAECGPRTEAVSTIEALRALGLRQVVCTDYVVGEKLEQLGLASAFDHIVVASDTYQLKPDARVFQRLCSELSVAPNQVLHIGDRGDTDGGAAAAGLATLILGREIDDLNEVVARVGDLCR